MMMMMMMMTTGLHHIRWPKQWVKLWTIFSNPYEEQTEVIIRAHTTRQLLLI